MLMPAHCTKRLDPTAKLFMLNKIEESGMLLKDTKFQSNRIKKDTTALNIATNKML